MEMILEANFNHKKSFSGVLNEFSVLAAPLTVFKHHQLFHDILFYAAKLCTNLVFIAMERLLGLCDITI
jgi:hypothetical protein